MCVGLYAPASWPLEVLSQAKTHYMEGMIGTRICASLNCNNHLTQIRLGMHLM